MTSLQIQKESELTGVVKEVLKMLATTSTTAAHVVALHGDLGAGKTTTVQYLARELGCTEPITSPTFAVMKAYELSGQHYTQLVHIDAYRIDTAKEMEVLHFAELLREPKTIICIEWAERITDMLPEHTLHMRFMHFATSRMISIDYGETN